MNEVTTTSKPTFSLAPTNIAEAMEVAQMLSKSNLVPKDYQGNPGNVIIAIQWGAEIGLQPLQAMQSIAVINGRPSIWGDAMLAIVRGSGLLEHITEECDGNLAVCTVKRRSEEATSREFAMEDAKRAGLTGKQGPWSQYPKRMLQLRARAFALRDVFPDVLRGVYVAEEAQDMPREVHMGAVEEVQSKPAIATTRSDKVRAAAAKSKAVQAPAIDDVLNAIHAAPDLQALKAAADEAKHLSDEGHKSIARDAYATRKAQLAVQDADPATGEIDTFVAAMEAAE